MSEKKTQRHLEEEAGDNLGRHAGVIFCRLAPSSPGRGRKTLHRQLQSKHLWTP